MNIDKKFFVSVLTFICAVFFVFRLEQDFDKGFLTSSERNLFFVILFALLIISLVFGAKTRFSQSKMIKIFSYIFIVADIGLLGLYGFYFFINSLFSTVGGF